ncbi:hypothetical protein [Rhizosaccharibacter radicis]|uniref:Uncharacterized protein n=1 Tax=Rhizosaccharibacter radicis TaxID=2782605 RepID=A0ABT1VZQ8_9PROT|nr:hypothetical protein [Acetobacteraceae bacterium KSS12]
MRQSAIHTARSIAFGGLMLVGGGGAEALAQARSTPASPSTSPTGVVAQRQTLTDRQPQGPGMPGVDAQQTTRTNNPPAFHILGIPVQISAPVSPPYNGDGTYQTFAGQPANGRNAIATRSIDGSP